MFSLIKKSFESAVLNFNSEPNSVLCYLEKVILFSWKALFCECVSPLPFVFYAASYKQQPVLCARWCAWVTSWLQSLAATSQSRVKGLERYLSIERAGQHFAADI